MLSDSWSKLGRTKINAQLWDQHHGPLRIAAKRSHLEIVNFLVEVGASKDLATRTAETTLYSAAQAGHLDPCTG